MVFDEPLQWSARHVAYVETKRRGGLAQLRTVEPGYGADEMNRQLGTVVQIHVADKKLCEAVGEESMNLGIGAVACTER